MSKRITLETVVDGSCYVLRAGGGACVFLPRELPEVEKLLKEARESEALRHANGKASAPVPLKKAAGGKRR